MSQEFLTLLAQIKAEEISPDEIWTSFVNTEFFVPILPPQKGASAAPAKLHAADLVFNLVKGPAGAALIVALSPEHFEGAPFPTDQPVNAVKMLGGQLVETLQAGVSVIVRLPDSPAFVVPASIMEWLRKSLQQQ